MKRVITYIDGFNLYFGMTQSWQDIKWLDINLLSTKLLRSGQTLEQVNYFTSRVNNNHSKEVRQKVYLEALAEQGVQIIYGQYRGNKETCYKCGNSWPNSKEKMTDVNIATHLLRDAFTDSYDIALLVSGDSDLVPPVETVLKTFPNKRIVVVFPPNRKSKHLEKVASASFILGRKILKNSQLPNVIVKADGYKLQKPPQWR